MEAHGGYVCRVEAFNATELVEWALQALNLDGITPHADASLQVSFLPRRKVVRFAYDAPHTYGRRGARWYEHSHALARLLSRSLSVTVHSYVYDPSEFEQVVSFGGGSRVGGEKLRYEDAEIPEDTELDDDAFEQMKARWPLGHLAYVFGLTRRELLGLPRAPSILVHLDGRDTGADLTRQLSALMRPSQVRAPELARASARRSR